jgi:hypothetical protein
MLEKTVGLEAVIQRYRTLSCNLDEIAHPNCLAIPEVLLHDLTEAGARVVLGRRHVDSEIMVLM